MEHTQRILDDIAALVPMGGVTIPGAHTKSVDFKGLYKRRDFFVERAKEAGLHVIEMKEDAEHPCPFIIITFPEMVEDGKLLAKVALVGHIDVVDGKPDLFEAKIEGDFIKGRGTTDMLGVDATFLEWMRDRQQKGGVKPPFVLMLSASEENDSQFGHNTYEAVGYLNSEYSADLEFAIVGERTGEMKKIDEPVESTIRDSNFGLRRYITGGSLVDPSPRDLDALLHGFAMDAIATLRMSLARANERDGTSSTFANPFFTFDTGGTFQNTPGRTYVNYNVPVGESSKHSAESRPADVTSLECAIGFVRDFRQCGGNVRVLRIALGHYGNFNSVSNGIDMVMSVAGHVNIPNGGLHVGPKERATLRAMEDPKMRGDPMISMGVEIREAPAHAGLVERLVEHVDGKLDRFNTSLHVDTLRSGWVCDPSNPHLEKLRKAFEFVTGRTAASEVKKFFNDGAAFIHHVGTGTPLAHAAVFGQTGFAPHGDLERHYIPSIDRGWKELDAFADQYLPE